MISVQRYCALSLKKRHKGISASEESQMEVYEFLMHEPEKATVFVRRNIVSAGVVDNGVIVTNSYGQTIGYGELGRYYEVRGSRRYQIKFNALNGVTYRGTYYPGANYAKVHKRVDTKPLL